LGTFAARRSDVIRANRAAGNAAHNRDDRPSKTDLKFFFGEQGYQMTWSERTEKFGIRPEEFQEALAKKKLGKCPEGISI
jgi:hypothetical protein